MSRSSCVDAISRARHRRSLYHGCTLAIAIWLFAPASAFAQPIVDPTRAEFDPSADHNVTVSGVPAVDHYEIGFYLVGAAQPLQVNQLGKPNPDVVDGKIRVGLGSRPSPGILYQARVSAVGPGGVGLSAVSNDFTFAVPCTYAVSPTTQAMVAGGGATSVAVTAASGCAWTMTGVPGWVTITGGGSGAGNGTVNYTVSANTSTSPRTADLTVAPGTFVRLTQIGLCSYAVSPTTATPAAGGGAASVGVTAGNGCGWTATESLSWVTITSGVSGTGNGTVNYTVSANTSTSPRSGDLTVAPGTLLRITQSGACSYSVSPTTATPAAGGGAASVGVTAGNGCGWTATESLSWVTITSGVSGTGNGTVNYTVSANTSTSPRSGDLTVAPGTLLRITQGGACSYSVSPTTATPAAGGGAASVGVTAGNGCGWTATESLSWVTITGGVSGTGNGTVNYTVSANTSTSPRSGDLTVAPGTLLRITQSGCSYSVSPTTAAPAAGGGAASVVVTTTGGCAWTAIASDTWVTITSGGSGTGSGTVSYSVSANTSTSPRTGRLTVAGQVITITQENSPAVLEPPSNLRIISRVEQGPSFGDRWSGIGAVPADSEDDPPTAMGWVAWIPERERPAQASSERPMDAIAGFTTGGARVAVGAPSEKNRAQRPTSPSTGLLAFA